MSGEVPTCDQVYSNKNKMQHLFFILFQAKKSPTVRRAKVSKQGEELAELPTTNQFLYSNNRLETGGAVGSVKQNIANDNNYIVSNAC